MSEPHQQSCSNNGDGARFTCPGCYEDLPYDQWNDVPGACPDCGRQVTCYVEMEPKSTCDLVDSPEDEE
ncbi:MAG: hypothetical protein V6Z86_05550 [Hyphomicrobiales bacterium]